MHARPQKTLSKLVKGSEAVWDGLEKKESSSMWCFAYGSNVVWRHSLIPLGITHLAVNNHSTKAFVLPPLLPWWRHMGWSVTENTWEPPSLWKSFARQKPTACANTTQGSFSFPSPFPPSLYLQKTANSQAEEQDLWSSVWCGSTTLNVQLNILPPEALQASSLWRHSWSLQDIINPHHLERWTKPDQLALSSTSLCSPFLTTSCNIPSASGNFKSKARSQIIQ